MDPGLHVCINQADLYCALGPLDVYWSKDLKFFIHHVQYFEHLESLDRKRKNGGTFINIGPLNDNKSDEFGILRYHCSPEFQKATRDYFPSEINWNTYFKLLKHAGTKQKKWDHPLDPPLRFDSGTANKYCPDMHAPTGISPGPSINVGKKKLDEFPEHETVRRIIGGFLNASQAAVDQARFKKEYIRIFDDYLREQRFSKQSLHVMFKTK